MWNIVHATFYLYFYYKEMIILKNYHPWLLIDFNEMGRKDVKRKYLNISINTISSINF